MTPNRKARRSGDTYIIREEYEIGPTLRVYEAVERTETVNGLVRSIDGYEYFIDEDGDDPTRVSGSYDWLRYIDGKRTITLLSAKHGTTTLREIIHPE